MRFRLLLLLCEGSRLLLARVDHLQNHAAVGTWARFQMVRLFGELL